MMGELTDKETECLHHCMHAILKNDIDELMEWGWILLDMPDNYPKRAELTEVINKLLNKYRAMTVRDMNSSSDNLFCRRIKEIFFAGKQRCFCFFRSLTGHLTDVR